MEEKQVDQLNNMSRGLTISPSTASYPDNKGLNSQTKVITMTIPVNPPFPMHNNQIMREIIHEYHYIYIHHAGKSWTGSLRESELSGILYMK